MVDVKLVSLYLRSGAVVDATIGGGSSKSQLPSAQKHGAVRRTGEPKRDQRYPKPEGKAGHLVRCCSAGLCSVIQLALS